MFRETIIERVLIAVDHDDGSRDAFYAGIRLANQHNAEMIVMHVVKPLRSWSFGKRRYLEAQERIERLEEGVRKRIDELWKMGGLEQVDRRRMQIIVRGGDPAREIVDTADIKRVDLVVLGTTGTGGMRPVLGRVPQYVVRHARCSVLCVRRDRRRRGVPEYE